MYKPGEIVKTWPFFTSFLCLPSLILVTCTYSFINRTENLSSLSGILPFQSSIISLKVFNNTYLNHGRELPSTFQSVSAALPIW